MQQNSGTDSKVWMREENEAFFALLFCPEQDVCSGFLYLPEKESFSRYGVNTVEELPFLYPAAENCGIYRITERRNAACQI